MACPNKKVVFEMAEARDVASGRCLCGAVRYEVRGPLGDLHACHCSMCRRHGGHFSVGISVKRADFELTAGDSLKWFCSSSSARRGFCGECGSILLWDDDSDEIGINAGSLDQPTGLKLTKHIFVDEKADYYEIEDQLEKVAGYDTPLQQPARSSRAVGTSTDLCARDFEDRGSGRLDLLFHHGFREISAQIAHLVSQEAIALEDEHVFERVLATE